MKILPEQHPQNAIQKETKIVYEYVDFQKLTLETINKPIEIYARVHNIRKSSNNLAFVILRFQQTSLQCLCLKKKIGEEQFNLITKLALESLVLVKGNLLPLPSNQPEIKSCSYNLFEFHVDNVEIINESTEMLPFSIDDANCLYKDETDRNAVLLKTRLDNRFFELRTPLNNVIFKLQSAVCNYFREYLLLNNFIEIHSPKLLGTSSESGASVFEVKYFNTTAYLAQSPQLYKQMVINADFKKVFEIGPVFRAEKSFSNRHLCEFTGMDIEMQLSPPFSYLEIIENLWSVLSYMFTKLEQNHQNDILYLKNHHNFEQFVFPSNPLFITFTEGVELLKNAGLTQLLDEDLTTENEKALGKIIKEKYNSDLFVLTEYPIAARPFYTKKTDDGKFTKSYDIIMRGNEICSGAQRENNYKILIEQMTKLNMSLQSFTDYLNSFKNGSPPHGGGGFGLERIIMLYFNLDNVRITSLFPRDPNRLNP